MRDLSPAEMIATLARDHQLLVVVIPGGVPLSDIIAIKADVDARLDALVAERDRTAPPTTHGTIDGRPLDPSTGKPSDA